MFNVKLDKKEKRGWHAADVNKRHASQDSEIFCLSCDHSVSTLPQVSGYLRCSCLEFYSIATESRYRPFLVVLTGG